MDTVYRQDFEIHDIYLDCFGRVKPSAILYFAQETAGRHCELLGLDWKTLARKELFWAVTRHFVRVTRLPQPGEVITVETWPMPTTRVAFPRSTAAFDRDGKELFRVISLWVLMDIRTRALVLPGKSGVEVPGILRGQELPVPGSLALKDPEQSACRTVAFTELDRNGHMNNTRYLDWVADLLPASLHKEHPIREFTVCYHSEAREGDTVRLFHRLSEEGVFQVDAHREWTGDNSGNTRVFSAKALYEGYSVN